MNSLIRFSPTTDMRRLQREIDGLFDSFFPIRTNGDNGDSTSWAPRVDLAETKNAYLVHVDLPGLSKDDLEINFHEGVLSISGERNAEEREEETKYVRVERSYGRFYRAFTLPQMVKSDEIEASFENGVLNITVPKAEEVKPRRIDIR